MVNQVTKITDSLPTNHRKESNSRFLEQMMTSSGIAARSSQNKPEWLEQGPNQSGPNADIQGLPPRARVRVIHGEPYAPRNAEGTKRRAPLRSEMGRPIAEFFCSFFFFVFLLSIFFSFFRFFLLFMIIFVFLSFIFIFCFLLSSSIFLFLY